MRFFRVFICRNGLGDGSLRPRRTRNEGPGGSKWTEKARAAGQKLGGPVLKIAVECLNMLPGRVAIRVIGLFGLSRLCRTDCELSLKTGKPNFTRERLACILAGDYLPPHPAHLYRTPLTIVKLSTDN